VLRNAAILCFFAPCGFLQRLPALRSRGSHRMFNRFLARAVVASLLTLVGFTLGCEGLSPAGPTAPQTPVPLSITSISPNTGSTVGAARVAHAAPIPDPQDQLVGRFPRLAPFHRPVYGIT
jgi:hypothetical protein